ncbi:hypothetical protein BKA70DRAFT_525808 [Coprinopsis sp. MPI-PUGE-AT-0042]|nr:hypothetical protein BKA70DRAFT_525808 [Coprinopsis sp. MPI-PUGE-AT-0042]
MKLLYAFTTLLTALQASAATLGNGQIMRRGVCDETCTAFQQINSGCPGGNAYYECFCKSENVELLDSCFSCLVLQIQTNDGLNDIVSGGGGFGLSSDSTVDSVIARGQAAHATAVNDCAAAGFAVVPGSNSPTTTGASTTNTPTKEDQKGSATGMNVGSGLGLVIGALALLV